MRVYCYKEPEVLEAASSFSLSFLSILANKASTSVIVLFSASFGHSSFLFIVAKRNPAVR